MIMEAESSVPLELFTDVTSPNVQVRPVLPLASSTANASSTQCSQPACYLLTFVTGPPGSRRKTSLCSQEVPGAACSPPHPSSPHAQFQELHSCNPPADVSASSLGAKPIGDGELLMTLPSLDASRFFANAFPLQASSPSTFLTL